MTTPTAKTLSPAELAKLEHAFATDPSSEAYKPLAEAYLGMGRFMEAMVVCKKGVKAHPGSPDPRLLLARVYAEQGKEKKALEELAGGLQVAPNDKLLLRMTGSLQMKSGEAEAGKANLLKAFLADSADPETKALLIQWKVELPPAAAPAPVAPAPAPVAVAPAPVAVAPAPVAPAPAPVAPAPAAPAPMAAAPAPAAPARRPTSTEARAARPPARAAQAYEEAQEAEEKAERQRQSARMKKTRFAFIAMVVALPLFLGSYYFIGQWQARRNREIKKALAEATAQLKHDSYESYKKACEAADQALELDPDSVAAHGYLAYAWAIRWGEHGGGDSARKNAEEHLEAAIAGKEDSSYMYAAQALIKNYAGKGTEGLKELDEKVRRFDAEGRQSSLMYLTLGLIQMDKGDLEGSRASLEKAQGIAPDDPRVYAALGALFRRQGENAAAWKNYDFALRYEKDHHDSMLGKALLMVGHEAENPEYFTGAAKMLKKLLETEPPPSPRQLAAAQLARALLISRVSASLPRYKTEFQQELSNATGVPVDPASARAEVSKAEETGMALDRQNPELKLIKARRLSFEGNFDAAVSEIRSAIAAEPTRAQFHIELAAVLMKKPGGEKEARDALLTAVKAVGESPRILSMLGTAYLKSGQPDEALEKASQEFVGRSLMVAEANTELARTHEEKGDSKKADEVYLKALNADPGYAPMYYHYARLLAAGGDRAKAKTTVAEYLKLDPKGEFAAEAQRLAQ